MVRRVGAVLLIGGSICFPTLSTEAVAGRHALLVGVSHYSNMGGRYQLAGPNNDVILMRDLLIGKFSFSPESICTLSETDGQRNTLCLPTRGNIERELRRLAEQAENGDQVVIFMAGHGSQQPEQEGGVPEIDGLDEIFLPRDVEPWQQDRGGVPNAIVDNEIAVWLQAIRAKGARLWVIFDCCHAGDMTRGFGERDRFVPPSSSDGLAIPADIIEAAQRQSADPNLDSERHGDGNSPSPPPLELDNLENIAVLYACQSHEKAVELPFPSSPPGKPHGLLTYSLNSVLSKATGPLSYRELSRRIHLEYVAAGRANGPTPLVEGGSIDRVVLGDESIGRSQIHAALDSDAADRSALRIDAGRLHGVTLDSILAVFLPTAGGNPADVEDRVLGYVRAVDVDLTSALVRPCEFRKVTRKPAHVLAGGRCEIVELNYGDLHLPVFVDSVDARGDSVADNIRDELESLIRGLAAEAGSLVALSDEPHAARWFVRVRDAAVVLVPARHSSHAESPKEVVPPPGPHLIELPHALGPFARDEQLRETLRSNLTSIARAENLLRLASNSDLDAMTTSGLTSVRIKIEADVERNGHTSPGGNLVRVQPGNRLTCRVSNAGVSDIDLTVLYVNSEFGIGAVFPQWHHVNRIRPGQARTLPAVRFKSGPFGRGYLVFIALASRGQPTDCTWLVQPTIVQRNSSTPLDALLENAMFGRGTTRSAQSEHATQYRFELLPVDVVRHHE